MVEWTPAVAMWDSRSTNDLTISQPENHPTSKLTNKVERNWHSVISSNLNDQSLSAIINVMTCCDVLLDVTFNVRGQSLSIFSNISYLNYSSFTRVHWNVTVVLSFEL